MSQATHALSPEARGLSRLGTRFLLLVAGVWTLIVLGALVRANDAGLACPDWPLCFGEFIPQLDVRVAFEWSHRVLAGGISLVFAWLSWRVWTHPLTRPSTRRLILLATGLLLVQILLGALTVWELLAAWTVTSHLVTGNSVAVAILLIGLSVRETVSPVARDAQAARVLGVLVAIAGVLLLQVVLGGLVSSRYAGLACLEWPACNGGEWFPTFDGPVGLHLLHRLNGYLLVLLLGFGAGAARGVSRLQGLTRMLLGLGLAQALVGILNVLLQLPVEVTGLHSALAALLVLGVTVALREACAARDPAC